RVTKDVAGLLFLLRRLTRRGRNAACGLNFNVKCTCFHLKQECSHNRLVEII
ncbi:hypothetical protein GR194_17070, partial [Klebsiella pneumoniae]|nr:hypothetical protein [Klebsiella pneumoniae]